MRAAVSRLCGAVLVLLAGGCATGSGELTRTSLAFEPLAAPPSGWLRVETPDFALVTDQSPELAQRAAQLLSQSLIGLRALFGRAPVLVQRELTIYALKDDLDFERRFGRMTWGFAFSKGASSTICLYGPPDRWFVRSDVAYEAKDSVLQHELAHVVLSQYFPSQPHWFAEGLAQFLETFRWLDPETVRFGDPSLTAYRNYRAVRSISVAQMLEWNGRTGRDLEMAGLYGLSWAFVHYALNRMPREFASYMALLVEHDAATAWYRTFEPVSATLDQAIFKYMSIGAYQFRVVKVPARAPSPASLRAMSEQERTQMLALFEQMERAMKKQNGEQDDGE